MLQLRHLHGDPPTELIHWTGIAAMVVMVLTGVVGVVRMARGVSRREGVTLKDTFGGRPALRRTGRALWSSLGVESLRQRRYSEDCKDDAPAEPFYRRRWLIHALTIWGFLGLLAATSSTGGST